MSSHYFKFTEDISQVPDASDMRVGFIVSEWNNNITNKLLASAVKTLKECGMKENNITVKYVPGSFELIYGASQLTMNDYDAVIAIGCCLSSTTSLQRTTRPTVWPPKSPILNFLTGHTQYGTPSSSISKLNSLKI